MTTEPVREPAPVEGGGDISPSPENPILGEIDRLNNQEETQLPVNETGTEEAPQPEIPDAPVAEQPTTQQAPAPEQPPAPAPQQPQTQYTPEQLQKMQGEAKQYQEGQVRAALQNQTNMYRQQLENQGFLPEHAQQAAEYYMQSQQQQQVLVQQADAYGEHLQGKMLASEHMVKKYKLGIDDLAELRKYEDPQSMESAAKKLAADRERMMNSQDLGRHRFRHSNSTTLRESQVLLLMTQAGLTGIMQAIGLLMLYPQLGEQLG